jgi:hypothetical protein
MGAVLLDAAVRCKKTSNLTAAPRLRGDPKRAID